MSNETLSALIINGRSLGIAQTRVAKVGIAAIVSINMIAAAI
jgi:hypothetical protein